MSKRAMCQNIFDTFIAYQMTVLGMTEGSDQDGWNKQKVEKCKFTSNHVSMALEDYNAGLVDYGETLENYMGKIHELKLITKKNDISKAIPYSKNLLGAGSYTHFLYTEWPEVEYTSKIRRQRQALTHSLTHSITPSLTHSLTHSLTQELADAMKAMKDARKKKQTKACKIGQRFQIVRGIKALDEQKRQATLSSACIADSVSSKEKDETQSKDVFMNKAARRQSNFIVDQANRRASTAALARSSLLKHQASVVSTKNEDVIVEKKESSEDHIKYLAMLAEANSADFEDDKVVHYITIFRPSYEKQLMFKRLNTFELSDPTRKKSLLGLSRNNRRYNIRPVQLRLLPVQGVKPEDTLTTTSDGKSKFLPLYFEDEDARNEPVGSFLKVDTTRLVVNMEDRAMLRQEQRRNNRSILLRLIPDYEELPADFIG